MLASSLIQATYFTVVLPREAQVPQFGLEVIAPILPILGEPLDCLKDWLFVGVAFSKRTCFEHCSSIIVRCRFFCIAG